MESDTIGAWQVLLGAVAVTSKSRDRNEEETALVSKGTDSRSGVAAAANHSGGKPRSDTLDSVDLGEGASPFPGPAVRRLLTLDGNGHASSSKNTLSYAASDTPSDFSGASAPATEVVLPMTQVVVPQDLNGQHVAAPFGAVLGVPHDALQELPPG